MLENKMPPLLDEEFAHGPVIPELARTNIVGNIDNASVRLVNGSVPVLDRRAIARVAYAAQRSMPAYKTGYDGTVTEDDQRLYVLAMGNRAIGLVLTALQSRTWRVKWAEGGSIHRESEVPLDTRGPVVARVWIASNKRQSGFGRNLTKIALSHLGVSASTVGWEFPFTDSGAALVRFFCSKQFLVCCDHWTLMHHTK
jgi:hypothetical protein